MTFSVFLRHFEVVLLSNQEFNDAGQSHASLNSHYERVCCAFGAANPFIMRIDGQQFLAGKVV
jgi:hypothetical protein